MKKTLTVLAAGLLLINSQTYAATKNTFQLEEATIQSVHQAMTRHQLTCAQLVSLYVNRIKQYDLSLSRGAPINAIVNINPSVMDEARALDKHYKISGKFVGPLHCIPVIVKDNIDTVDSTSTSGSLALLGSQPTQDAYLVKQLRAAGAIIIGKGSMDEFAAGMSGISGRSGRTGNAYDPNQNPGGSSSGPAAAVSANFAMIGIGTDNSGSVRIPAAFNGIDGLRPSTGLISQSGIFPRGSLDGVAGPITRNIQDMAAVLAVIAKADQNDPKTLSVPRNIDYSALLQKNGFQNKRIGIIRSVSGIDPYSGGTPQSLALYQATDAKLQKLGATLVDINLPNFNTNRADNMAGEIQDINQYLAAFPSTRQSWSDICNSGRTQLFGSPENCLKHIQDTADRGSVIYNNVLKMFLQNRRYVENIMAHNHIDVLLMPINAAGPASYDGSYVNTWRTAVSSNSGLPAITFNVGYINHLPVGMELIGKMYGEGELLNLAYAYQSNSPHRELPKLPEASQPNLMNLNIPEFNNLITDIGYQSYQQILKSDQPEDLTPAGFKKIVAEEIKK